MAITARGNLNGHDLTDIPVLNPGDWFGKAWLIELGGSYSSLYLIVEADSMSDAIDELAESEKYGHQIVVKDDNLGDYPEDNRHYSGTGQVLDLDHCGDLGVKSAGQKQKAEFQLARGAVCALCFLARV